MYLSEAVDNREVTNPRDNYPSVTINELLSTVRLDASKGEDLLAEKTLHAMDNINEQLIGKYYLIAPLSENQTRIYKRAVCYEAAALIAEDNLDFDTSSTGQIRGENGLAKEQSLRRVVNHAIADLTGRPRNRVTLV